jgi:peptidoglycan/LPS O-acetylase OafA/YrhL
VNVRAGRFPLLDSLRAVAALSVLLFHAAFVSRVFLPQSHSFLRPYMSHLDVGVTVFFLISGFLLYRPFVRARLHRLDPPHTGAYAWRRFLRIAPAYWVALTVIALWFGFHEIFPNGGEPLYYAFGQVYSATKSSFGIPQAWTLCVEVTFYALLPAWAFAMRRMSFRWELAALALMFVVSVVYKVWALRHRPPGALNNAPYLQTLPNFLDQFSIGMALAVLTAEWERAGRVPRAVDALRRHDWLPWVFAALAFWAVSTQIGLTGDFLQVQSRSEFLGRHELYTLVGAGVFLPAIFAEPGRGVAGRVLATRVLSYLGLISYAIFLYHLAVLKQLDRWLGQPMDAPLGVRLLTYTGLGFLIAVAIASVSYYVVERPALRLKRLVSPPSAAERGEATAEPVR